VTCVPPIVYIVDDDLSVRRGFARLLQVAGLRVQSFASAESFLDADTRGNDACVVVDIHMEGLSGTELQERLAARKPAIPVIMISAGDAPEIRKVAQRSGVAAFFRKPVDGQALLDAIYWALAESDQASEPQGDNDEDGGMA
jgi:FixJ family two-component response regulator